MSQDRLPNITREIPRFCERPPTTHKGHVGRVAIIAGARGMSGAAALCGRGALRSGAGLVRIYCPESVQPIVAMSDPCLMTVPIAESQGGLLTYESLVDRFDASWADVVAIGPGLGQHHALPELVSWLLRDFPGAAVIDADALNNLATSPQTRWEDSLAWRVWQARSDRPTVITPHPGEMARLRQAAHLAEIGNDPEDRLRSAHDYAALADITVVLKGHDTVVAKRNQLYVNSTGNPGMASGGMGDVLTGIIAALLGQNFTAFDAARLGVWLHGQAADDCAREIGPVGYLAHDVADALPGALRTAARARIGFR